MEQTLLKWTTEIRGSTLSKHNTVVIWVLALIILVGNIGYYYFGNPSEDFKTNTIIFLVGLFLCFLLFLKKKQIHFVLTDKAIYKGSGNQTVLKYLWGYKKVVANLLTGNRTSDEFYLPYEMAKFYRVADGKIFIQKKTNLLSSGLFEFLIVPNNNLDQIIAILDKHISRQVSQS